MSDALTNVLLETTHTFVLRNATTSTAAAAHPDSSKPTSYKIIGLILAISSGLFIGVSFILKKFGLLKANVKYNEEAGEGYGYLKNAWWWSGMTLMIMGEICNFAAYLFADAILVTPLGALSVVITAILSGIFLKERLSFVGKIGCFQCIVGAVIIAANAPEQGAVNTIQDMKHMVLSPGFLSYAGVIIIGCACVAIFVAPKYGSKSMLVYLTICSLIGGLSVVGIQGIGAAITAQARGISQFKEWFTYVLMVFVIVTLVTEIIYLNKALNLYNAALVTPTYYVYFTSATIVSSAILFRGFKGTTIQILTVVLGFLVICSGVVLLQLSKSAKDVPDAAVFAGDLDQVRTVAEQEEPEYEPRADTIRGSAALLRAVSQSRQRRETKEVQRIQEEHMLPINEGEQAEWDGLRRRRTISSPGQSPLVRRKTLHPPLGMSNFPDDDGGVTEPERTEDPDNGMHPGFWSHFRRSRGQSGTSDATRFSSTNALPMSPLKHSTITKVDDTDESPVAHPDTTFPTMYPIPSASNGSNDTFHQQDTSYRGNVPPPAPHIHWSASASAPQLEKTRFVEDSGSPSPHDSSLNTRLPSTIPSHSLPLTPSAPGQRSPARRQFSFQHVFNRGARSPDNTPGSPRPGTASSGVIDPNNGSRGTLSRGALSFTRKGSGDARATEEERLGLVRGDSVENSGEDEPPLYESPRQSDSEKDPIPIAVRRKDVDDRRGPPPGGAAGGTAGKDNGTSGRAFI